jgi:hypothetical protein
MKGRGEVFTLSAGPLRTKVSRTPLAWTSRCWRSADRTVTCTGCASEPLLAALDTAGGPRSPH